MRNLTRSFYFAVAMSVTQFAAISFAVALSVVACTTQPDGSSKINLTQAIEDARLIIGVAPGPNSIGTGITGAYQTLKTLYPQLVLKPGVDESITTALNQAPVYLNALSPLADSATNATNLRAVLSVAGQVLNLIAGTLTPAAAADPRIATVILAFQAAATLEQFITPLIRQLAPSMSVGAPPVPAIFRSDMKPEVARTKLKR